LRHGLLAALRAQRIDVRELARVGFGVDADAHVKGLRRHLVENGNKIQLFIIGRAKENLLLVNQAQQDVRMPAAFEHALVHRADQRLGGRGRFDHHPVARFYRGGIIHQDARHLFNPDITHRTVCLQIS
jgi:hypothetical protein